MLDFNCFKSGALIAALCLCCISARGQKVSQEWLTDAFDDDLKVGTRVCVTTKFSFSRKFGEKIVGEEKGKTVRMYDEHGFYTQVGETTYKNTYLEDGRISEVEVYEKGKMEKKMRYSYSADGVARVTYNSDGQEVGVWASDGKGTENVTKNSRGETLTKTTLNGRGKAVKENISMSSMNGVFVTGGGNSHSIAIMCNYHYNEMGVLESCLVQGVGRSQNTDYEDYKYDEAGNWTSRFKLIDGSPEQYEKRTIYATEEDYAKFVEEAKRREAERIARELEAKKQKERDYLAQVKAGKETPKEYYSTATYSVDRRKAAELIEKWLQANLKNGEIASYENGYDFRGFSMSAEFVMDESGKVARTIGKMERKKSRRAYAQDPDLWEEMPFKDCRANAIRLETLDSIAYLPTKIEMQIGQPSRFNFKSATLKLKYDKKTQAWVVKNEKDLTKLDAGLKKRMLDFVLSKPFMQEAGKIMVVVKYDANVDVVLRSKDRKIHEEFSNMTVFEIDSYK